MLSLRKGVLGPSKAFRPLCLCPENSVSWQQRPWFEETRFERLIIELNAEHLELVGQFRRKSASPEGWPVGRCLKGGRLPT